MMEMENISMIQGHGSESPASSCTEKQNTSGTSEKIDTPLTQAGSLFDHYRIRQSLINRRNLTSSANKREQFNLLLVQLDNYERAEPKHRTVLAKMIERQMALL